MSKKRSRRANGRPKGMQDSKPRKKRKEWTSSDVAFVKKNWDTMSNKEIAQRLGFGVQTVVRNGLSFGLKPKNFVSDIKYTLTEQHQDTICGVYGVIDNAKQKIYIGSSYNCQQRHRVHWRLIRHKNHFNTKLNQSQMSDLYFAILQECEENDLIDTERLYINKYSPYALFNSSVITHLDEVRDYIEHNKHKKWVKHYEVVDSCWLYLGNKTHSGYGKINLYLNGSRKTIMTHRAMFYLYYGEYPSIVRHTCNNRSCMNPAHLLSGSSRDNAMDKTNNTLKMFEDSWIRHKGNRELVAKELGWTHNGIYTARSSNRISAWLKKTNLREEYPQYVKKPRSRLMLPNPEGLRGPKIKDYTNQIISCWKCVDNNVGYQRKRWICENCGRERVCSKWVIEQSNGCSVCGHMRKEK